MSLFCLLVCLLFFSQCAWWCPALQVSLFTCFILFPVIWLRLWLVVLGNLDVSLHMSPFICLPRCLWWCPALRMSFLCFHLSLIICPSPCVSHLVPLPINLSPIIGLPSGSFACSPLCIIHDLSLTICLVFHRLRSLHHMFALVAVSCSSFILIVLSVLIFLFVSLLSPDKIMFHHGFMRFTTPCVPLVSYLVLLLSPIQMLSVATKAKPCALTSDSWCFPINMDQQLPASGASNV